MTNEERAARADLALAVYQPGDEPLRHGLLNHDGVPVWVKLSIDLITDTLLRLRLAGVDPYQVLEQVATNLGDEIDGQS